VEWKHENMFGMDMELLTSIIERIGHDLEEQGIQKRQLSIISPIPEMDPEEDKLSISFLYNNLLSSLSGCTNPAQISSKVKAIQEISIDIGLSSIGLLKPPSERKTSFSTLEKFVNVDSSIELSEGAKSVLEKWGDVTQGEEPKPIVRKRRRVKVNASQNVGSDSVPGIIMSQEVMVGDRGNIGSQSQGESGLFVMSQPQPGRYGMRVERKQTRRSGF
jgi:RNA polymerase I-specific transcription-initiation factor